MANVVPCLGGRGEGPGKWLILYQVWGGGAWEVANIVPSLGGRGLGSG